MKLLQWYVAAFLSLLSFTVRAELLIEITQGVDNPTAIAVVPFGGLANSVDENITDIITADLKRSGLFRAIPKGDMLSFPQSPQQVFYRDWRILGAEYVLIGQLKRELDSYVLEYGLYDVLSQRSVFNGSLKGRASQIRRLAHKVSDRIYEKITGIRGAFSTKILYVQDLRSGPKRYRLMVSDADGARERLIFESSEPLLSPSWSSDGSHIVYVSFETSRPAIFKQHLATGKREQLTNFKGLNGAPTWSPDDKYIAMVLSKDGNPEIYTLEVSTRKLRRVTKHFAIDTEPNWSVDGRSIVFTSNRGGSPQVYKVTLSSGKIERLTFQGDYNARPRVTPDGKGLVMVHRDNGVYQIALQDLGSGRVHILTKTQMDESPSIAPNGAMLLYAARSNNRGVLAAVSMDAGVRFLLPAKKGDVREPAWSPFIK